MEVDGEDNISRRNILEGHSRPIELRRIHPFGIMTGIVLDKKEIDALERRAEVRRAVGGGADKLIRVPTGTRGGKEYSAVTRMMTCELQ